MSASPRPDGTALERALGPVAARVRLVRAVRAATLYAVLGGLLATLAGLAVGAGWLSPADRERVYVLGALLCAWGFALGWMRAPSLLSSALLVDRTHPFGGRIAAGIGLLDAGPSEMARLAVADAAARARTIEPARAMPWSRPLYLRAASLALVAALLGATLTPPSEVEEVVAVAPAPRLRALDVHEDDLAVLSGTLASLPERRRSPELRAEIDAINELVEALSAHEVERTEALRRLGEISEGLRAARPGTLDATIEALAAMSRPLSRSPLAERVGDALASGDLETAADEMERLGERLEREPPSEAELARLREAMASAAEALDPETLRREREALEEQEDRLLHREEEEASLSETERAARAEERERELERLRRDIEERREREEELESLRRELEEAMREHEAESGEGEDEASSGLSEATESMRRFADEASGESEREELEREIESLRELVRRMREGGSDEDGSNGEGSDSEAEGSGEGGSSRMDRFVLRARGEGEGEGEGEGMPIGTPGGGEEGEGTTEGSSGEGGEGEREEGASGSGAGTGEAGEGEGMGASEMLVLGRGEDRLEIPGMGGEGSGSERGPGSGEGEGEEPGDGAGSGTGAGAGDPTGRLGEHTTVRVTGEEGAGPTRSEVIRTSAARGFASREYRDVYGDYRRHADESLDHEEIPPGYRFYVERYFQLIRPRE